MNKSIHKRFWEKVKIGLPDKCWEWQANLGRGYGMFSIEGRSIVAHRVSWTMLRGPIPEGMLVLHKCDNRKCVNPNHLFIGTQSDNVCDMLAKGRGGDYRNGNTKVYSLEDAIKIDNMLNDGASLRSIAREYNTTHQAIKRAITDGRLYKPHKCNFVL